MTQHDVIGSRWQRDLRARRVDGPRRLQELPRQRLGGFARCRRLAQLQVCQPAAGRRQVQV